MDDATGSRAANFSWSWERLSRDNEGDHINADHALLEAVRILAEYAPADIKEKALALAYQWENHDQDWWWA